MIIDYVVLLGWVMLCCLGVGGCFFGLGCLYAVRIILVVVSCFFGFAWLFDVGWAYCVIWF